MSWEQDQALRTKKYLFVRFIIYDLEQFDGVRVVALLHDGNLFTDQVQCVLLLTFVSIDSHGPWSAARTSALTEDIRLRSLAQPRF